MHVHAILNMTSGTLRTADATELTAHLERAFKASNHTIGFETVSGSDIQKTLSDIVDNDDVECILVGGGDGTISLAAGLAWKSGKRLGVLPAGTMNLFARSLRIPLTLEDAIPAMASAKNASVDIATINGRPFVHQASVGLQARAIRIRNKMAYASRQEKILASIRAAWNVVFDPPSFPAIVSIDDDDPVKREVSAISISNNPFGKGHMPYADTLTGGKLGVYTSAPVSAREALTLGADIVLGSWAENDVVDARTAKRVKLEFPRKYRRANVVVDGELIPLDDHLDIEIHPAELKVLVPA